MSNVLIVDDDRYLLNTVSQLLSAENYKVFTASSATEGWTAIVEKQPDLLILDVGLQDGDGYSLCRKIRAKWTFPVLMLTSRNETTDKVMGLEVGADDYLTKPFEARELVARVRAHLRRNQEYIQAAQTDNVIQIGDMKIDLDAMAVNVRGEHVLLTALEFKLLEYFARNSRRALSRDQLFEQVWGYDEEFNTNSLEVMIYRLRTKLEKPLGQRLIHTVRGHGYRLELD